MRRWLGAVWLRWGHFRSDADLRDEMQAHFEMNIEDHRSSGASDEEARRLAHMDSGRTQVAIEKVRDGEWITVLESWFLDIVWSVRALRKSPLFFFTAVITLALGIGATTAVFSFLYGLVLRSIPTQEPAGLMEVGIASSADASGVHGDGVTYRILDALKRNLTGFTELSGWSYGEVLMEGRQGSLRRYPAGFVTGNAFKVIPMRPYLGRLISPYDDVPGGSGQGWPAVLSYGFWNDRCGRDPAIVGKQIRVSNTSVTVIGVTPPEFKGVWPGTDIKMYLPLQFVNAQAGEDLLNEPDTDYRFAAIGRLRPGVSVAQANAEAGRLKKRLIAEYIPVNQQHLPYFAGAYLRVRSVRSGVPTYITRVYAKPLYLMQGLVGIVLLLCCVNVGGLMMSKVYSRRREFAVRTALGARAWRLVRQYLTESFVIAAAGSVVGAFLAWRGCDEFLRFFRDPMMGEPMQVHPDHFVFFAAGFLTVLTTFLFGALPAWRAGHADPGELLKSRTSLGGKRRIAGRAFVPVQVALSLALVVLASLLAQSVQKLRSEHTGFDTDHITIQSSPLYLIKSKGEAKLNLYQRMVDRLDQMPGVRSAAVTSRTPLTGEPVTSYFQAVGSASNQSGIVPLSFDDVGPGYFHTMRTPIVSGRAFNRNERSLNVCVLNRSAAQFLFRGAQAIGQYVRALDKQQFPDGTTCRVVGIAADTKFSDVRQGPPHTIYFPVSMERFDRQIGVLVFLINSESKLSAISGFRRTVSELAPTVPLVIFVTLREQMDAALGSEELITLLSSFFGVVALLLSALGLYGMLSASVVQRTGEIGLRLALGGDRPKILRMILLEAMELLGWGLLGGMFVLFIIMRFAAAMLHGVSRFDPITLATVVAVLTGVIFVAALVPAWRAATIDPMEALRTD